MAVAGDLPGVAGPAGQGSPAPAPDARRWIGLAAALSGGFLHVFNFFVVNIALPSIAHGLGATAGDAQFLIAGYGLAYAVLLITAGRLGDRFGRKRIFLLGMAGFTLASALCALAPTADLLIASRVLQGLAAAAMVPQVLAIIQITFPPAERPRALGYFATSLGLGSIAGQLLGGVLVGADLFGLGWRAIFLVDVPVGLAALAIAARLLPESRSAGVRLDLGGVALLSLGLFLLIFPLIEGRQAGWPGWVGASLLAAAFLLAVFIAYERAVAARGATPLLDLALFRNPSFVIGLVMVVAFYGGQAAFFLVFTVFLQQGFGFTSLTAAYAFLPFACGFSGASALAARAARLVGSGILALGSSLMIVGLISLIVIARLADATLPWAGLVPAFFVYGIGQGLVMSPLVHTVLGRIASRDAGIAAGTMSTVQQIALALGVAVIGGFFFDRLGASPDRHAFVMALAATLMCNIALAATTIVLSLLVRRRPAVAHPHLPSPPVTPPAGPSGSASPTRSACRSPG